MNINNNNGKEANNVYINIYKLALISYGWYPHPIIKINVVIKLISKNK